MSSYFRVTAKVLKDIDFRKFDELRKRIEAGKHVVRVGVPSGTTEADGTPVALIAAVHEFGAPEKGIPERPFLRTAIQENRGKYARLNRINLVAVLNQKMTMEQALGQLGEVAKGDVQANISDGKFQPLAESTIKVRERKRSKGYSQKINKKAAASGGPVDKPLIETGQLRQSIAWEIE